MDTHRIKVKLGDAEFDAEGSPEAVQAQFDAFLKVISAIPKLPTPAAPPAPPTNNQPIPGQPNNNAEGLPDDVMARVFRRGDNLSLAALPSGENAEQDAMIALLYGYAKLLDESTVTGTSLMKSAKISGVSVERVDRVVSGLIPDYVLAAGVKKARRYQLNNRGLARAENIIRAIFQ